MRVGIRISPRAGLLAAQILQLGWMGEVLLALRWQPACLSLSTSGLVVAEGNGPACGGRLDMIQCRQEQEGRETIGHVPAREQHCAGLVACAFLFLVAGVDCTGWTGWAGSWDE